MLAPTDEKLERLMYLRDQVIPYILGLPTLDSQDEDFLWDEPKADYLNLNVFACRTGMGLGASYDPVECGTAGCVMGWYMKMRYNISDAVEISSRCGLGQAVKEFDIEPHQAEALFAAHQLVLFDGDQYADVQARAVILEDIIEAKVEALA